MLIGVGFSNAQLVEDMFLRANVDVRISEAQPLRCSWSRMVHLLVFERVPTATAFYTRSRVLYIYMRIYIRTFVRTYIAVHYITLHCITLYYTHYTTLHYTKLHYITYEYLNYRRTYTHVSIYIYTHITI